MSATQLIIAREVVAAAMGFAALNPSELAAMEGCAGGEFMSPDRRSVRRAIREFDHIDDKADFLARLSARPPKIHYLLHEDRLYPLKVIWAAAHTPPIKTGNTHTEAARRGMRGLGFDTFVKDDALVAQYFEGKRTMREVAVFSRDPKLAADAKAHYRWVCQACGFDFEEKYGELGKGYIECHHVDPLSGRDGRKRPASLEDVTVLCANCHRMVHWGRSPCLTVEEFKAAISASEGDIGVRP